MHAIEFTVISNAASFTNWTFQSGMIYVLDFNNEITGIS